MFEDIQWENIYACWRRGSLYFPNTLNAFLTAETVFVEYKQVGCIYGYDWLEAANAEQTKQLIRKSPTEFLFFTKPSNKGTIYTAQMLIEAQNEEELAAIWVAATAKELSSYSYRNDIRHYADALYRSACTFLNTRYYLWHHAMRKLVPEVFIPLFMLESMVCKDAKPLLGLIQMNTMLLKSTWRILRYSSLKDGELPESDRSVRRPSL